ncbi:MAG: redoxin domain-containing protein [Myxococcales bacterium]|nr:redoxin domain-containing protein [Myxococcales bacterium]MCB9551379.1 redoxin domain-containing protein [Myxococcales bacterium]
MIAGLFALLLVAPGAPLPWFAGWTADETVYNRTSLLAAPAAGHALVFFATWCAPCGEGLAALAKQRAALDAAKIRVVLVACGEAPAEVKPWLAARGWGEATVIYDRFGQVAADLGAAAGGRTLKLPWTVVVDPAGTVRAALDGDASHDLAAWQAALRAAAAP